MNPKDKSRELIEKFYGLANDIDGPDFDYQKQCALICVGEMIRVMNRVSDVDDISFRLSENNNYGDAMSEFRYWMQVEEEIKNATQ